MADLKEQKGSDKRNNHKRRILQCKKSRCQEEHCSLSKKVVISI